MLSIDTAIAALLYSGAACALGALALVAYKIVTHHHA